MNAFAFFAVSFCSELMCSSTKTVSLSFKLITQSIAFFRSTAMSWCVTPIGFLGSFGESGIPEQPLPQLTFERQKRKPQSQAESDDR